MKRTESFPTLSVIIPTYQRAADVQRLLGSLEAQMQNVDVFVVDDCSPDPGIFDGVKARFSAVHFVHLQRNEGPGGSRNRGAREATADLLLFLDSDTELVPGSIETVRAFFAAHPEAQVCSGGISPEPINVGFFPRYKALLETSWTPDHDSEVTFVAGRCFAVRRTAFLQVGGFNTAYAGADVEDFDLGYRLRRQFGAIRFLKDLKVKHRYPSMWQQARLYYRRVILWMALRSTADKFDNVGTTRREGLISVLSALLPIVLVATVSTGFIVPGLLFLGLTVIVNRKFLRRCLREQGFIFAVRALFCHSYLAIWICAGVAVALCAKRAPRQQAVRKAAEAGHA